MGKIREVSGLSSTSRNRIWLLGGLWALLLCLVLVGCSGQAEGDEDSSSADSTDTAEAADKKKDKDSDNDGEDDEEETKALPVAVTVLNEGRIEATIRASASLEAERQVQVRAEAARHVVSLKAEEGDRVSKGQLLCSLKDDEQRSALTQAEVSLAAAKREFERQTELFGRELTSEENLNLAREKFEQQELVVKDARRELSYARVVSPMSGTVTQRLVTLGSQVSMGQHLFDVVDFESLVALVYVPEKNLKDLKVGLPVRLWARAVSDQAYEAKIKRIAPVVDPSTGTVKVTVAVGGQAKLRPGLFVDVEIVTQVHDQALLIPKRSLIFDNDQVLLFRLVNGTTVERLMVEEALSDEMNLMPKSGFALGDTIVVAGQTALKDGSKVEVVEVRTGESLNP
ncbi:MAG: efflux RND transporter periplasmic adaptor subunit [Candidatus Eisenbacteria bacterium]|uniref:Efflux RND transporter periplasmic adaptor subunit n=1 Tax=Eiseniibacteriota bacterium TaxID=2212470 RepID=A0A7Y2H1A0_UNCEI|nr:efflux RND transporter periplasmic adaptor subunit [Candidatus Eisenbacteria bacterium]